MKWRPSKTALKMLNHPLPINRDQPPMTDQHHENVSAAILVLAKEIEKLCARLDNPDQRAALSKCAADIRSADQPRMHLAGFSRHAPPSQPDGDASADAAELAYLKQKRIAARWGTTQTDRNAAVTLRREIDDLRKRAKII